MSLETKGTKQVLRWLDEGAGEKVVDIVVSLNEQAGKLHGQEVATASYSDVKPTLKTFDEIGVALDEVETVLKKKEGHEGEYLKAMVNGFRYFARSLQGDDVPYNELIENIQELPSDLISDEQLSHARELVDSGLSNLGYKGTLREKSEAWRSNTLIDPEQVTAVAENFREISKQGTLKRVISLPEEDGIDWIKPIRGVFWSGYSKYTGDYRGNLTFNIDRPWTEPILAQIMTHEAYPGHQAFYCRWDYLFQQGKLPLEASYYLINSPTNALFEGGPETALSFLGWDDVSEETQDIKDEQKQQYLLARNFLDYQRMFTTNACYMYNLGQISKEEAIDYLINKGGITEIEANNAFRFFSDPVQKTYFPCYFYGRWMVGNAYKGTPKDKRSEFFSILYDTPHTTKTFIKAISQLHGKEFDAFNTLKQ
ncbi:hypothetical protein D1B31_14760 [Neobacillus notoginsengisoli]|uniref:DUF885 domain-containing protein n=1 Tax=Neobacillus notoginsengisoli TaxID=1578198 RepID=A0A417YRX5_9BACI|nr:hypothetical protein [Neobacillus notoginsengisoli]RHW38040.1 hypothetical protein D1B31_14760 [Neobacillus notoginsengisoli]